MGITRLDRDDSGIGLIEIVVSIFLLGLLAVAALPLFVQALRVAPQNASVAAATQLVSTGLSNAQQRTSCALVSALASDAVTTIDTATYRVVTTVGACPASYPGTVPVTVEVSDPADPTPLSSGTVLVFVTAAS